MGLIEGLAESTALIVKVFSGALSDYLGRRKGLAVVGYGLGALSKPLFAISTSLSGVVTARLLDRVGKGIRGAPRDALVADIAPEHLRGSAFGLRQALDTVGAFAGPLLAVALMLAWSNNFRAVFWVAAVPGAMAVALLFFGLHEPRREREKKRTNPIVWANLARLGTEYWVGRHRRCAFHAGAIQRSIPGPARSADRHPDRACSAGDGCDERHLRRFGVSLWQSCRMR